MHDLQCNCILLDELDGRKQVRINPFFLFLPSLALSQQPLRQPLQADVRLAASHMWLYVQLRRIHRYTESLNNASKPVFQG
jgi:hypothetical protein